VSKKTEITKQRNNTKEQHEMSKEKQKMLPGTENTVDEVGKAAEVYLDAVDKVKDTKDDAQTAQDKLAELM